MATETGMTVSVPKAQQTKVIYTQSREIQALENRLKGIRGHVEKNSRKIQTAAVAVSASFIFANFQRDAGARGLPTVGQMDPALVWGGAAYFLGPQIGGMAGEVAEAAGLGILCAFAYQKGAAPSR
jgi:hypothetical protein